VNYISTKLASEKWGISQRRVRVLCEHGKIKGAIRTGKSYSIPENAKKPQDSRFKPLTLDGLYERIELKKQELSKRRPLTQGELERLNEDFMIEYTYNSNAIEGNTLTLKETALVLRGLTIDKKPLRELLEATQHRDAFYFVCDLVEKKVPLSESVIMEIHSIVLNDRLEERGVYRRAAVRIVGAVHVPPNPLKVPNLMEELMNEYLKSEDNAVKKIAKFHLRFERIHPFIDGNGRTGRLIANLEFMKAGYPPIDIKFTDRKEYYDCFSEYEQSGKTEKIERMFASYVLERIEEYLKIIC